MKRITNRYNETFDEMATLGLDHSQGRIGRIGRLVVPALAFLVGFLAPF